MAQISVYKVIFVFCFLAKPTAGKPIENKSQIEQVDVFLKINDPEKKYEELKDHYNNAMTMDTENITDTAESDVYFTANPASDLKGLVKGETVIYGFDFTNSGGGYNENTGIFTAPVSGVYMFSLFCSSSKAADIDLILQRDGRTKGNCEVEPSFDGEDENSGVVYVDRLNVGDQVWVEVFYSSTGTVELTKNLNTFAGVLIHR